MEYMPIKDFKKLKKTKNTIVRINFIGKSGSLLKNYEGYVEGVYYFTDLNIPRSTKNIPRYSCKEVELLSPEGILLIRPKYWEKISVNKNSKEFNKTKRKVLLAGKDFSKLLKTSARKRKQRLEELANQQTY